MKAVAISQRCAILAGSDPVSSVGGNVFNSTVSGGNGTARGRQFDDWDEED